MENIIYFTIVFVILCIHGHQLIDISLLFYVSLPTSIIDLVVSFVLCVVVQEESIRILVVKTFAAAWFTESFSDVLKRRRYGEYMWFISEFCTLC